MKPETYKGFTIEIGKDRWFHVTGQTLDKPGHFPSYREAMTFVDDREKLLATKKRIDAKLALAVVTEDGKTCTVTGIHPNNRTLNGAGKDGGYVFPALPWLIELRTEAGKLKARLAEINEATRPFSLTVQRGYSGNGLRTEEGYKREIAELTAEYDKRKATSPTRTRPPQPTGNPSHEHSRNDSRTGPARRTKRKAHRRLVDR